MPQRVYAAVVAQLERRTADAVAFRFFTGQSLEDIRQAYALTRAEVERYLRAYATRRSA